MPRAKRPETLGLKKIHHVAIICSDYTNSKTFYTKILGLEILRETYRQDRDSYKLDLVLPNGDQLELFSFPHPPARLSRPEARGLRHLAFEVSSITHAIEFLQSQEIEVEPVRKDEITGKRFTFFSDPDDLPIELYES